MVPTVTKDEGLHSPKAIAFIGNRPKRNQRLEKKKYSILRKFLKTVTEFLKEPNKIENRLNAPLMKNLGDKKWTK